jgi:hypothetical protein
VTATRLSRSTYFCPADVTADLDNSLNFGGATVGKRTASLPHLKRSTGRKLQALLPALLLPAAACLVPQSVDPESTQGHVPPRVVVESVDTRLAGAFIELQHGSIDAAASCSCQVLLSVPQIEDDDPTATLEVRWFVDYDPDDPLSQRTAVPSQFLAGSFDSTATVRLGPTLTFDLGALSISDGIHVVDMVTAEQGGFDDTNTTFAHRAVLPGYASATFRFVVSVVTNNDSACRMDSPWERICPQ